MGQAKLRGTKEQRIAEGIARAQEREYQFEKAKAERWAKMTPKQREFALFIASMQMGIMSGGHFPPRRTPEGE